MQPGLPPFTVTSSVEERVHVVRADGELDVATAPQLRAALNAAEDADAPAIRLDLSGLTFIDSTGIAVLVEYTARSRANSDRLRILSGPAVDFALEVSGTRSHLPLVT